MAGPDVHGAQSAEQSNTVDSLHSPPFPAPHGARQGDPGPVRRVIPGGGRHDRPVTRPTDRSGFVPPSTGGGGPPPSQPHSLPPTVTTLPGLPTSARTPPSTTPSLPECAPSQGSRTVPQHPPAPALATRNRNRSPHPLHLLDHTSRTTRPAGTGPSSRGRGTGPHEHWTTVTDSERDPWPRL